MQLWLSSIGYYAEMANGSPGFVGVRLKQLREDRRLTAAQLADLTPGGAISGTMITNVETGRKRDLTATELVTVAAALQVSPLDLMIDRSQPWEPVPFGHLGGGLAGMTNIEFLRRASAYPDFARGWRGHNEARLLEKVIQAEVEIARLDFAKTEPNIGDRTQSWHPRTEHGEEFIVRGTEEDVRWEIAQRAVDRFREALGAAGQLSELGSDLSLESLESWIESLESWTDGRLANIRKRVLLLLTEFPDLDVKHDGHFDMPEIDPRTGRALPPRRPPMRQGEVIPGDIPEQPHA